MDETKTLTPQGGYDKAALMILTIMHGLGPDADAATWKSRVTNVAVHAWLEGHIEAENQQRGFVDAPEPERSDDPLPAPPFPRKEDDKLYDLIDRAVEAYPGQPYLAAVRAAADGWAAGFREGMMCPGCRYRGKDPAGRRQIETGGMEVKFVLKQASSAKAFPAKQDQEEVWEELLLDPAICKLQEVFVTAFAERMRKNKKKGKSPVEAHGHALMDALAACLRRFAELGAYLAKNSDETDAEAAEEFCGWVGEIAATVALDMHEIRETAREAADDDEDDDDEDLDEEK
jgi:hypothetical protein